MPTLITIDNLKAGMILAVPIKNKFGQLLLPAETNLEDKHKKILTTWGITSIYISTDGPEDSIPQFDITAFPDAKEKLEQRMKWNPRNAVEEDLLEIALKKLIEKNP